MKPRCGECFKDIANKCNRCGINLRHQDYECCEPCLNEMLLGHPANPVNNHKWNQFVLTLTDALINRDRCERSEINHEQTSNL